MTGNVITGVVSGNTITNAAPGINVYQNGSIAAGADNVVDGSLFAVNGYRNSSVSMTDNDFTNGVLAINDSDATLPGSSASVAHGGGTRCDRRTRPHPGRRGEGGRQEEEAVRGVPGGLFSSGRHGPSDDFAGGAIGQTGLPFPSCLRYRCFFCTCTAPLAPPRP